MYEVHIMIYPEGKVFPGVFGELNVHGKSALIV